ncbi:MAG: MATE family efflux transporter [Cardiobacteriaceae bacterium]|nr:MATE family efflux transporter [Cardiobacteriaceae bacterium]
MRLHDELAATLKLAIPLILMQILSFAQPIVDTIMAGRHSDLTLASVALAAQIFSFIYMFMVGCSLAMTAAISQANGRDDRTQIRRHFQQGIWMLLFLGISTVLLTLIGAYIPSWLGSTPEIALEARHYLLVLAPGAGISILGLAGRCFLEGMSYPRTTVIVQALLIPVNIIGNYVFLYGYGIIPALGVPGMALSTALCYLIFTLFVFSAIARNPRWRVYRPYYRFSSPDISAIRRYFSVGLPISCALLMEIGLFVAVGLIVSRTNEINAAANQIALNYAGLSFMIPLGLASALTIRCGNAYGKNDYSALRRRAISGIIFVAIVMIFMALLPLFLRHEIAALYSTNDKIIDIASSIFILVGLFQIGDGLQVCTAGILRGIHDTRMPMFYAFIGYWLVGFPTALIGYYWLNIGVAGLWIGMLVGLSLTAILGIRRVFWQIRKR